MTTEFLPEPIVRIRDNPVLIAQARRRFRRRKTIPALVIAFVVAACALLLAMTSGKPEDWDFLTCVILGFIGVLLLLRGTTAVQATVSEERLSGLLDFHRATPTTPLTDVLGYVFGPLALDYAIVGVLTPFLLVSTACGEVGVVRGFAALGVILLSGVLYHALACLTGLSVAKGWNATLVLGLAIVALHAVTLSVATDGPLAVAHLTPWPAIVSILDVGDSPTSLAAPIAFYGITLSPAIFSLFLQGTLLAFVVWGCTRRMRMQGATTFSRPGAFLFFGILAFVVIGGLWPSALAGRDDVLHGLELTVMAWFVLSMTLATILGLVLVPSFLEVKRTLRRAVERGEDIRWHHDGAPVLPLVPRLAAVVWAGLGVLLVAAVGQNLTFAPTPGGLILAVLATLAFLAFVLASCEYVRLRFRRAWGGMALLVLFLAFILPWMLAGVFAATDWGDGMGRFVAAMSPTYAVFSTVGHLVLPHLSSEDPYEILAICSTAVAASVSLVFFVLGHRLREGLARELRPPG